MSKWHFFDEEKPTANGFYITASFIPKDFEPVLIITKDYWKDGHFYFVDEEDFDDTDDTDNSDGAILAWTKIRDDKNYPAVNLEDFKTHGLVDGLMSWMEVSWLV